MITVTIWTYGTKHGPLSLPGVPELDVACTSLHNPHHVLSLRDLDGRDPGVQAYVKADPKTEPLLANLQRQAFEQAAAKPPYGHTTMALHCYGGRHRSIAIACLLADRLRALEVLVDVQHRIAPGQWLQGTTDA